MDYKEAISEIHDELCQEFEDQNGRAPNQKEYLDLYAQAQDKYETRMADYAEYLKDKGE